MEHKALISDYETAVSCARELNLSAEELASISSIGAETPIMVQMKSVVKFMAKL